MPKAKPTTVMILPEDITALCKPAGLPLEADVEKSLSLLSLWRRKFPQSRWFSPLLMDDRASGLILVCQQTESHKLLQELLQDGKIQFTYRWRGNDGVQELKTTDPRRLKDFPQASLIYACEIQIAEKKWTAPETWTPWGLASSSNSDLLSQWQESVEKRKALAPEKLENNECLRLIHTEGTPLRIDKLGTVAAMGWWRENPPSPQEWDQVREFLKLQNFDHWVFRHYRKKTAPQDEWKRDQAPDTWMGQENSMQFEFRRDQGQASGLFLDQREHRSYLRSESQGKSVLNLFAYTGGFSVAAALGGAEMVTTVDLSRKYVDWSKTNFEHNQIPLENHRFYDMDSLEFLKYAAKKGLQYDIIVCDPPSYSRNKKKDFRVDRDFGELIERMAALLRPGGWIHFSTNFEEWNALQWLKRLQPLAQELGLNCDYVNNYCFDFEWIPAKNLMKAFHLKKEVMDSSVKVF